MVAEGRRKGVRRDGTEKRRKTRPQAGGQRTAGCGLRAAAAAISSRGRRLARREAEKRWSSGARVRREDRAWRAGDGEGGADR